MNIDLQAILGELYELDPSLRGHEQELIPVIKKMLITKPDVTPNSGFVEHLRMTLREKANFPHHSPFFSFFTMHKLQYTLTGLLIGVIVAAPLTYSLTQSGAIPSSPTASDSTQKLFTYSVDEEGSKAFGDLSTVQKSGGNGRKGGGGDAVAAPTVSNAMMARPQSGGGDPEGMITDKMMVAPEMTEYHLKFEGLLPTLASSVDVFKRLKGTAAADLSKILGSFNMGLMNLGSFTGAKTDMISFYQDTKYGYMGTVSFREGSISLNQNYPQWPHPENTCQDEACYQRYRLKAEEIPADNVLISIAQAFVKDHGIDLSQYGDPEVDNNWKTQYAATTDKSMMYIPESARVVYPLIVDGKPVYEDGGMKAGISINVNAREKRVSDAYGIMDQKYQKSAYVGVFDETTVRSYLDNYGKVQMGWMPPNTTVKQADVTLGTPVVSLVRMYTYRNNVNEELLVPALIFPVVSVSEGAYFYQTTVAVPLAADLLKDRTDMGNPVPMPLMMEDNVRE